MAGILDSKTRILDAAVTVEGRRQMAEGTFNVSFATFCDEDVVYEPDETEGHVDPSNRLYLEAQSNLPEDQVIFEANDDGNLVALRDMTIDVQRVDSLFPRRLAATFVDGKTLVKQLNFGARIQISSIPQKFAETGVGFSYTDSKNQKAFVFLSSSFPAGTNEIDTSNSIIYVGVKGGINSTELTTSIQEQIEIFSSGSGPKVQALDRVNNLYILDISGSHKNVLTSLFTGTIGSITASVPFILDESFSGGRTDTFDLSQNADFASQIEGILTSSFENFKSLNIISTTDTIFEDDKFELENNAFLFDAEKIDANKWANINQVPTLNSIDSIFNDDKLSNLINFRYLPPIVSVNDFILPNKSDPIAIQGFTLGNYPPLGDNSVPISFAQILEQMKGFEKKSIKFTKTSRKNNLLCQLFEVANGTVKKLDIIEYGDVRNDPNDPSVVSNKVYFVGKTFLDNRGTTCYVNMFTIIFSRVNGDEEDA